MVRVVCVVLRFVVLALAAAIACGEPALGQSVTMPPTGSDGQPITRCADIERTDGLPPAGSPPLYRCAELRFHPVNETFVPPETYRDRLNARWSAPSESRWVPYDDTAIHADFWHLWETGFLDDLWVEVIDEPYANGVSGKHVIFHMEERPRIKQVDYVGSTRVSVSAIEEALSDKNIQITLDSFVEHAAIRQVRRVIRDLYAERGFHDASITTRLEELPAGPKLVRVSFEIDEGPEYHIQQIVFEGNQAFPDEALRGRMQANREVSLLSLVTKAGTYQESRFADDAEAITRFYLNQGYIRVLVGQPTVQILEDSPDGHGRWIRLQIPVDEGERHRVGRLAIVGSTSVREEALLDQLEIDTGDWFNRERLDKSVERLQEIYGRLGFWKAAVLPDFETARRDPEGTALVDITIEVVEGDQYLINRIEFLGNTTTHDDVVRRELRLYEGAVFDVAALHDSVRRLNQLGYFQPLEGRPEEVEVRDADGRPNMVDLTFRLVEQNRNQISFGAGVSQVDGFFGQLQYQTSNFMGRGETLSVSLQRGSRAVFNQIAFTRPYLFGRPISGGVQLYARRNDYYDVTRALAYSEARNGAGLTVGLPVAGFTRAFVTATYEVVAASVLDALLDASATVVAGTPLLTTQDEGRRLESYVTASIVHNTVDHPYQPRRGMRLTAQLGVAGGPFGGEVDYLRPEVEAILYKPVRTRMALGVRAQGGWIRPYGSTVALPYYRRFYLGGEQQIRGVEYRSVGPLNDQQQVLGGDRFVLFNLEYYLDLGPLRLLAFHDAGQAFLETEPVNLRRLRTSSGVEARFLVPYLNVPFRLIYAWNLFRDPFQPARTFRFAVGTTF